MKLPTRVKARLSSKTTHNCSTSAKKHLKVQDAILITHPFATTMRAFSAASCWCVNTPAKHDKNETKSSFTCNNRPCCALTLDADTKNRTTCGEGGVSVWDVCD